MIMGRMPKEPWLGNQRSPRRNFCSPTFQMSGTPSTKMKKAINPKMEIEDKAINSNIFSMNFSLDISYFRIPVCGVEREATLTRPSWTSIFCPSELRI